MGSKRKKIVSKAGTGKNIYLLAQINDQNDEKYTFMAKIIIVVRLIVSRIWLIQCMKKKNIFQVPIK